MIRPQLLFGLVVLSAIVIGVTCVMNTQGHAGAEVPATAPSKLTLHTRSLVDDGKGGRRAVDKSVEWDPKKTALIICDMWDDHWCKSASRRVDEMAGPLNEVVKQARAKGIFIIHAPSSVTDFYKGTPQRKRAQDAPFAKTPKPLTTAQRWGTAW